MGRECTSFTKTGQETNDVFLECAVLNPFNPHDDITEFAGIECSIPGEK